MGAGLLGPFLIDILFGEEFELERVDLVLLALSSAAFMLAVALGQALIALEGQSQVALGWLVGVLGFLGVTAHGRRPVPPGRSGHGGRLGRRRRRHRRPRPPPPARQAPHPPPHPDDHRRDDDDRALSTSRADPTTQRGRLASDGPGRMRARTPLLVAGLAVAAASPSGRGWPRRTRRTPPRPCPSCRRWPSRSTACTTRPAACAWATGEVDCSIRAEEVDRALSHGPATETRHLEGFVGSALARAGDGAGPTVVGPSVGVDHRLVPGPGLARNEGTVAVETIEVTARLLDAAGAELATVTGASPVHDVRPGEPVPFDAVDRRARFLRGRGRVVGDGRRTGDGSARALAWTPYWERPVGGEPVDLYLHRDGGRRPPVPPVRLGRGRRWRGVDEPEVVVAWLTAGGQVAAIASAPVRAPDGSPWPPCPPAVPPTPSWWPTADPPAGGEVLVWVQGS